MRALAKRGLIAERGDAVPAQRRWLASHGWAFEVRADGKNRVLIEEAHSRMLTGKSSRRSAEPDLEVQRALG